MNKRFDNEFAEQHRKNENEFYETLTSEEKENFFKYRRFALRYYSNVLFPIEHLIMPDKSKSSVII